ncbi:tyrosine-type recombinase/integrase [Phaeobacter gallaeciensis]|jgi:integrase|uniref:tyrosine-type recombinase/integrase n=1 Tax=Phaeobacter gallaeciensis TaxID=60890 RepID=UPI00237F2E25|nr:tyrosine-type recombinase/integrase [Phaeobacter gallaeciensis]MDE4141913.1 tyrosine-type recombinase/integrase [Phaeobacter gallaeciensis]MDE4150139.1 tyrosine-type recombinase/integrase [Phaeobacter gallaeciensis]MDE4154584.1 tyrosine-type recombinase/integrase [Phaeobacter gallaeciensis]MDE4229756.1 tyrosine-type recombinase/integrase [Phaeobacter gallaeciensis]MDE4259050.1 tyrosine-type recombinase/integrase [Phaeobacter gallaeciensis]
MPRKRKPARLFQRKDDGAWVIIDGGKHVRTGFGEGLREQAEEALAQYIRERATNEIVTVELHKITIGEILVRYGEERMDDVKDPERLLNAIKALAPYWADKTVSEVNVATCKGYLRWRGVSAWTMRREMGTLNAALRLAAERRRIPYAPPVKLPPKGAAKDRWLRDQELSELLSHSAPHVQRFIRIAVATGRRKSAILGLRWLPSLTHGWIDLERGVIHFLGKAEEETKKKKGVVRIPEKLLEEMKTWDQDTAAVISYEGHPVADIKKAFAAAARRAGLTEVTPHTLKHTAVTWAFMAGMTLEQATDYFATSRDTLEDVYRSYSPHAQKEAAAIMDRVL